MNRVRNNGGVPISGVFNAGSVQQAGRAAFSAATGVSQAAAELEAKAKAEADREAGLSARIEYQRAEREAAASFHETGQSQVNENSDNHAAVSEENFTGRFVEGQNRLANNPNALKKLNELNRIHGQNRLADFESQQRELNLKYQTDEYSRGLDDSQQLLRRQTYSTTPPNTNSERSTFNLSLEANGSQFEVSEQDIEDFTFDAGTQDSIAEVQGSPTKRKELQNWLLERADAHIEENELDDLIGQTFNGQKLSRDGLRAIGMKFGLEKLNEIKEIVQNPSQKNRVQTGVLSGFKNHKQAIQGKIRSKPLSVDYQNRMTTVVRNISPELDVRVVSGSQLNATNARKEAQRIIQARGEIPTIKGLQKEIAKLRTGSTRHDENEHGEGETGDLVLTRNGRDLLPDDHPELYEKLFEGAGRAGFTGVGHYKWGVHIGGGAVSAWGPNRRSNSVNPVFDAAFHRGRKAGPSTPEQAAQVFGDVAGTEIPRHQGALPDLYKHPVFAAERQAKHDIIDGFTMSKAAKAEAKRHADSQLVQSALDRMKEENPSAALAALRSGKYDKELTYKETEAHKNSILKQIEGDIKRRAAADKKVFKEDATVAAQDIIAYNEGGRIGEPPQQLSEAALNALTPALRRNVETSGAVAEAVIDAKQAPLGEVVEVLENTRPSGEGFANEAKAFEASKSVVQSRLVDHLGQLPVNQRADFIAAQPDYLQEALIDEEKRLGTALKNNFVTEARKSGAGVQELDPANFSQSIQERFNGLSGVADRNGLDQFSVLTPTEKLAFTERFRASSVTEKMGILTELSELPSEVSTAFFSDISKNAPMLAHAGGLIANGNADAAATAIRGLHAIDEGRKFDEIPKADVNEAVADIGLSNALRAMPSVQSDVQDFALNYARGLAQEGGHEVKIEHYKEGVRFALGGEDAIQEYNGVEYVLPVGTKEREFENWIGGLDDAAIRKMNNGALPSDVNGTELDAEYIKDNARLVTVGQGRYAVQFSDGSDAMNEDGSRLILDYSVKRDPDEDLGVSPLVGRERAQ